MMLVKTDKQANIGQVGNLETHLKGFIFYRQLYIGPLILYSDQEISDGSCGGFNSSKEPNKFPHLLSLKGG